MIRITPTLCSMLLCQCHFRPFLALFCLFSVFHPNRTVAANILVVGATGGTGMRAIQGLLDAGLKPEDIRILTRNPSKCAVKALAELGFDIFQGDLDVSSSLEGISKNCTGCYIHSTSSDTAILDRGEVERAKNLCCAIQNVSHVVYNSVAAAPGHGIRRISQKHNVEKIFALGGPVVLTSLRSNLFMEELWKEYTRPQILQGSYPLPVHRKRKIYLTSVCDLGRLAGYLLQNPTPPSSRTINIAGDYLTGPEIAHAFSQAQGSPCRYYRPRKMEWMAWFKFRELWEQIHFLQTSTETTDLLALQQEYPGLMTTFEEFLAETRWGDKRRSFADFSSVSSLSVSTNQKASLSV